MNENGCIKVNLAVTWSRADQYFGRGEGHSGKGFISRIK